MTKQIFFTSSRRATRWLGIAGLFLSLVTAFGQKVPVNSTIMLPNTDTAGPVLQNQPIPITAASAAPFGGAFICEVTCSTTAGCSGWTWQNTDSQGDGNCWLKSSLTGIGPSTCCTSGGVGDINMDRPGGDFTHFPMDTPRECRDQCTNFSQCLAWSWVNPGVQAATGVCWLKNTVPPAVNNNCCQSGIMEFLPPPPQ